ncbi:MAG TPA: hypothetical protein VEA99_21230 [Gemmatimonadaceae bacterium]|nr:hypothetical protein [Gemmatimonadaceae bacterium]
MTAPRSIRCHHCGTLIASRAALRVGGRALLPLHATCYGAYAAAQPWYRHPGWPLNRWRSFVPFNALLLGPIVAVHLLVVPVPPRRWAGLAAILALANGWLLVGRLVSYRSLERYLPAHEPRLDTLEPPTSGRNDERA